MKKNFWKWHAIKERLHNRTGQLFFREREIWFCSLGVNVGHEQDGKSDDFERPVLIFKKFSDELFWAIPLTSKRKEGKYYFEFEIADNRGGRVLVNGLLSQMRLLDSKRLRKRLDLMSQKKFWQLLNRFKRLLPIRKLGTHV